MPFDVDFEIRNYINLFWKLTEAFSCLVGINDTVLLVTVLSVFNFKKILFSNSYAYMGVEVLIYYVQYMHDAQTKFVLYKNLLF